MADEVAQFNNDFERLSIYSAEKELCTPLLSLKVGFLAKISKIGVWILEKSFLKNCQAQSS